MTTLSGGQPTPCCIGSRISSDWIAQLDQPGHYLALDTYGLAHGATWLDYTLVVDESGYLARWEVPTGGPIYIATARHCSPGGVSEVCDYAEHQYFDSKIDGQPMPEPGTLFGLLLGALLVYSFHKGLS